MNLGESNNFFRESFRGFNKDDVAEYIAKLSRDYTANEEKYKEHIAKLNSEVKIKTDEVSRLEYELETHAQNQTQFLPADATSDEYAQKYKDEIRALENDLNVRDELLREKSEMVNELTELKQKHLDEIARLTNELEEKDVRINELQSMLDSDGNSVSDSREEIEKYKEAMNGLSREIEEFKGKCEALASETDILRNEPKMDKEAVNELSLLLAESEAERLYTFNLIKKFISALDIKSAQGKDVKNAANISDIAPQAEIAAEIEEVLCEFSGMKQAISDLETENSELRENLNSSRNGNATEEQMYKTVMEKLGETVYSANKSADDTIAKAKNEAAYIIDSAKTEANDIIETAKAMIENTEREDKKKMAEIREKYAFIKKEHEIMYAKYKEITEIYSLSLADVEDTISAIYDSVADE